MDTFSLPESPNTTRTPLPSCTTPDFSLSATAKEGLSSYTPSIWSAASAAYCATKPCVIDLSPFMDSMLVLTLIKLYRAAWLLSTLEVFTCSCINSDCLTLVNKERNLNNSTCLKSSILVGIVCRITSYAGLTLCDDKLDSDRKLN